MEIRLLGGLELLDDNGASIALPGAKRRALLAALAIRAGQVVSSERLVEELWGEEAGPNGANLLQALVSKARRVLPSDTLVTRPTGYALEVPAESVDIGRFDALVLTGRKALAAGEADTAGRIFREALGLWRGTALSEFAYEEFAQTEISRLSEERASVIEDRMEADLLTGRHGEIVAELEAAVAAEPLRERLRGQLMLALYRSGRQADALRQFQDARKALGEELGLEPGPELRRLEAAILIQDPELAAAEPARVPEKTSVRARTNLRPPPTETIGREDDLSSLLALTSAHRMLTIVGPGGVGKTRLAIEAGLSAAQRLRDGAWFVELAPLRDPASVVPVIAARLGITGIQLSGGAESPLAQLAEIIAERELLLILDNCEHLIDESARVAGELLAGCPRLRLIATSRERLGLAGEWLWSAPPLALEPSTQLFVARAAEVAPDLNLSADARDVIASICDRLDGLPLAIELAAARTRTFPVAQIAERLDDRFGLLKGGPRTAAERQQTLHAVVDWSYDLLSEPERHLFDRLSIFVDGCDLDAAEAVCSDELVRVEDVSDLLTRLVDKSLVVARAEDGQARFLLLQTLADYGRERLAAGGSLEALKIRHAEWYRTVAGDGLAAMFGRDQRRWLSTVRRELGNLRLAIESAISAGDAELAQGIAGNLGAFYWASGYLGIGLRWLDAALACAHPSSLATRGLALTWRGFLAVLAGRVPPTDEAEEAVAALEAAGDPAAIGLAKHLITAVYARAGQTEPLGTLLSEAHEHFIEAGARDPFYAPQILWSWGVRNRATGDYESALPQLREFVDHPGNTSDFMKVIMLGHVGDMCESRAEYGPALEALERASRMAEELHMDGFEVPIRARLANLAILSGATDRADALRREAMVSARQAGCIPVLAGALTGIATHQLGAGNLVPAASAASDALVLYREMGHASGSALALIVLGWIAEAQSDGPSAETWFARGYVEARRGSDSKLCRDAAEGLAAVALLERDAIRAARLLGVASRLHPEGEGEKWELTLLTAALLISNREAGERVARASREQLGSARFEEAFAAGGAEDLAGIDEVATRAPTGAGPLEPGPL